MLVRGANTIAYFVGASVTDKNVRPWPQDDSAKAEIILKSALDEKDFADDDYHQEQGFEYQVQIP
jgi:hypothetical protein